MPIRDVSLLPSAQEFLSESLRNLRDERLTLAILHAVTATELILKERLRRLSPALILKDIDTKSPRHAQTVSLAAIPHRLANLGSPLDGRDAQLVRDIAEWRHEIVHHMPSYDTGLAARQLPKLLDFLASQLRAELGTPLEGFLPVNLYRDASRYIADWRNAVDEARGLAAAAGEVVPLSACSRCGGIEVMSYLDKSRVHCYLCQSDLYVCDHCPRCHRKMVVAFEPDPEGDICDECSEELESSAAEMDADIRAGR